MSAPSAARSSARCGAACDRVDRDPRAGRVGGGDDRRRAPAPCPIGVRRRGHRDPARAVATAPPRPRTRAARACRGRARPSARSRRRARRRSPTGARWRRGRAGCTTTSSPGPQRAADGGREPHRHRGHRRPEGDAARLGAEQPARPPRAPPRRTSSVACAAANTPPWLALSPERMNAAIASIAASTICVPGGPVEPRPAAGEPGEAVAVHSRASAARTSSTSCG